MATLSNIVKYKAYLCAEKINELKTKALKTQKAQKPVFLHSDGRVVQVQDYKWSKDDGFAYRYVDYDKTVDCINPKHDNWQAYRMAKSDAAIWLTAARLLKVFDRVPTRKDIRKSLRSVRPSDNKLLEHCAKLPTHNNLPKWTRRHFSKIGNMTTEHTVFMALDYLEYVLKNPLSQEELARVDAWVSEKTAETEARRAACPATA